MLYPENEIANFQRKDEDNATLICVVYVLGMQLLYLYINIQRENIVSSFIFSGRLAMPVFDEQNKSHAFLFYSQLTLGTYRLTKFIIV